jgi:hypothetical protein
LAEPIVSEDWFDPLLGRLDTMSTLIARLRAKGDEEAAVRVEALEMVLVEMLAKCSFAMREQWCGCVDCHCVLARRALRRGPVQRRPDPTPDKINEAFKTRDEGLSDGPEANLCHCSWMLFGRAPCGPRSDDAAKPARVAIHFWCAILTIRRPAVQRPRSSSPFTKNGR